MRFAASTLAMLALACARAEPADGSFTVFAAGIPGPRALAAAHGRVYVLDGEGYLRVLDPEGKETRRIQIVKTARGFPAGITVAADGRLFVADAHESRVLVLSPEGERLASFGSYGSLPGQFVYPQRIAFLGAETFVTEYGFDENNRVQVFSTSGEFLRAYGGYGKEGLKFARPEGIAAGPDGSLYVADSSHRIVHLTPDGRHLGDIGRPGREPGMLDYPFGLAAASEGLYVTEHGTSRVSRFAYDGSFAGCYGPPPSDDRGFLHPRDLAFDGRNLFVADTGKNRIIRLAVDRIRWEGAP